MKRKICMMTALAGLLAVFSTAAMAAPAVVTTQADPQRLAELKARADKGDMTAQLAYGHAYLRGTYGQTIDPAQAVTWLTRATDAGSAQAAFELAQLYDEGKGVAQDTTKAMELYGKASEGGQPQVASHVCARMAAGSNSPDIWALGVPYCQKASAQNDVDANHALGIAYSEGWGVAKDTAVGLQFLQRAAGKGSLPAMTRLAEVYTDGTLVPQDYARALYWHRQAARNGSAQAVRAMAAQYEGGLGTPADLKEAARMYEILARNGDAAASGWLKAHPEFSQGDLNREIVTLANIPSGLILYAVASNDPRFTTLDMSDYVRQMSQDIYPMKALEADMAGMATAECRFTAAGEFRDCVVVEENPVGYGFGPALIRMMDALQNSGNKSAWTKRYAGKILRITTRWKLDS